MLSLSPETKQALTCNVKVRKGRNKQSPCMRNSTRGNTASRYDTDTIYAMNNTNSVFKALKEQIKVSESRNNSPLLQRQTDYNTVTPQKIVNKRTVQAPPRLFTSNKGYSDRLHTY